MFGGRKMYPTESDNLTAESVQGASLALEGVDDVNRGHGLAAGVLGVGHGVANNILKEHLHNEQCTAMLQQKTDLQDTPSFFIDEPAYSLDSSSSRQSSDGWLGDALNS